MFVRKGKICIHEKWSILSAKNGKILRFRRKKSLVGLTPGLHLTILPTC